MAAQRARQIRDQGHHHDAAPAGVIHRSNHDRLLTGHDNGAVAIARIQAVEAMRQGRSVKGGNALRHDIHAVCKCLAGAACHGIGQAGHELIGAVGNDEGQSEVAGPGQQRSAEIALKADSGNRGLDLFRRDGAHARTAVEHAVDRGQRDPGGVGHVMDGGAALQTDFVHEAFRF